MWLSAPAEGFHRTGPRERGTSLSPCRSPTSIGGANTFRRAVSPSKWKWRGRKGDARSTYVIPPETASSLRHQRSGAVAGSSRRDPHRQVAVRQHDLLGVSIDISPRGARLANEGRDEDQTKLQ